MLPLSPSPTKRNAPMPPSGRGRSAWRPLVLGAPSARARACMEAQHALVWSRAREHRAACARAALRENARAAVTNARKRLELRRRSLRSRYVGAAQARGGEVESKRTMGSPRPHKNGSAAVKWKRASGLICAVDSALGRGRKIEECTLVPRAHRFWIGFAPSSFQTHLTFAGMRQAEKKVPVVIAASRRIGGRREAICFSLLWNQAHHGSRSGAGV